jgi:formiminotetrahydrofolate cyclodeaminase
MTPLNMEMGEFTSRLAAEQPTPGGGSAAALGGALAAALVCMVCRYTIGRERYRDVEADATRLLDRAEELRSALERATEDDIEAYQGYAAAQGLPKETPEQVEARAAALQSALRDSTIVPLEVAKDAAELVRLAHKTAEIGNRYLISDAGVAASLALAAFEAAALNVELNAAGIEDGAFSSDALGRLAAAGDIAELRALVERTYAVIRAPGG